MIEEHIDWIAGIGLAFVVGAASFVAFRVFISLLGSSL